VTREESKEDVAKNNDENSKKHEKKDENSIYMPKLPNTLTVAMHPRRRNLRLSYFINRARKILRCNDTLIITGVERAISMTCTLVELLKRQKIGNVTKIVTTMNLNPNFGRYGGNLAWGRPVPTIVFHMVRGDHATYVSDFHQRKVIELFESKDTQHAGKLSKQTVEEMNLAKCFLSNKEQVEHANKFIHKLDEVDLPHFIHYCSVLIHPLLKEEVFKEQLATLGLITSNSNNDRTATQE